MKRNEKLWVSLVAATLVAVMATGCATVKSDAPFDDLAVYGSLGGGDSGAGSGY